MTAVFGCVSSLVEVSQSQLRPPSVSLYQRMWLGDPWGSGTRAAMIWKPGHVGIALQSATANLCCHCRALCLYRTGTVLVPYWQYIDTAPVRHRHSTCPIPTLRCDCALRWSCTGTALVLCWSCTCARVVLELCAHCASSCRIDGARFGPPQVRTSQQPRTSWSAVRSRVGLGAPCR